MQLIKGSNGSSHGNAETKQMQNTNWFILNRCSEKVVPIVASKILKISYLPSFFFKLSRPMVSKRHWWWEHTVYDRFQCRCDLVNLYRATHCTCSQERRKIKINKNTHICVYEKSHWIRWLCVRAYVYGAKKGHSCE